MNAALLIQKIEKYFNMINLLHVKISSFK